MTFQLPARQRRLFASTLFALLLAACATTTPPADGTDAGSAAAAAAAPAAAAASAIDTAAAAAAVSATSASAALAAANDVEIKTAPVPIDPLRPDVRMNLYDRSARVDLWDRVRRGFAMADLDTDLVRERERWYVERPDYVQRMTERGSRYLFHILEEVEKRGMPTELALLPFIESAFNPQAISSSKASGMWQFMSATGRDFDLKQNVFRDDRRSVLDSTRAALDYLQRLHDMFGDWQLALAAYNWGEGNVQRAIRRNQADGRPTDYLSLRMPSETQYYVPKLQAVKNIVARPQDFGLTLPELSNHPFFLSVPIERDMDVALAVRLAGMKLEDFQNLNPQMNQPVMLAAGTPQVLLPYDNANQFVRSLPQYHGSLASWTAWVAPKNMRPAEVARQVGMSEEQLRQVNRIPPRMLVRAGSTLLVPRAAHRTADVSEHLADNAMMMLTPDGPVQRRVALRAGKRDSVATIARRYHVRADQVAQWNGVSSTAKFSPGQSIVVFVPHKAPRTRTRRSSYRPRAAPKHRRIVGPSARAKAKAKAPKRRN